MMSCLRIFEVPRNLAIAALVSFAFVATAPIAHAQAATSTDAAATFKSKCATCHAADGSGSALGKRLHAPDLRSKEVQSMTPAALAQVISAGKNQMPAFGNRLDKDQIQKLVDYVRTFHADASQ
jgi:mono/diheme cytochrome c family protein